MSNRQFEHDLDNPAFYQQEESGFTDAEYDAYYNRKPASQASRREFNDGTAPDKTLVAEAMVAPILRGYISADGTDQDRADAVSQLVASSKIPHCGIYEEWLDRDYVDDVWNRAQALIEHAS